MELIKRLFTKLTSIKNLLMIFTSVIEGFIIFNKLYEFKDIVFACIVLQAGLAGVNLAEKKVLKGEINAK